MRVYGSDSKCKKIRPITYRDRRNFTIIIFLCGNTIIAHWNRSNTLKTIAQWNRCSTLKKMKLKITIETKLWEVIMDLSIDYWKWKSWLRWI